MSRKGVAHGAGWRRGSRYGTALIASMLLLLHFTLVGCVSDGEATMRSVHDVIDPAFGMDLAYKGSLRDRLILRVPACQGPITSVDITRYNRATRIWGPVANAVPARGRSSNRVSIPSLDPDFIWEDGIAPILDGRHVYKISVVASFPRGSSISARLGETAETWMVRPRPGKDHRPQVPRPINENEIETFGC